MRLAGRICSSRWHCTAACGSACTYTAAAADIAWCASPQTSSDMAWPPSANALAATSWGSCLAVWQQKVVLLCCVHVLQQRVAFQYRMEMDLFFIFWGTSHSCCRHLAALAYWSMCIVASPDGGPRHRIHVNSTTVCQAYAVRSHDGRSTSHKMAAESS